MSPMPPRLAFLAVLAALAPAIEPAAASAFAFSAESPSLGAGITPFSPELSGRRAAGSFSFGRIVFVVNSGEGVGPATTRVDAGAVPTASRESAVEQFRAAGVAVRDVTPGTALMRINEGDLYAGTAVDAARDNVFSQTGSNEPVCFTLDFGRPVRSVRLQRAALMVGPNGVSHPRWRASALSVDGAVVAGAGENKLVCIGGEEDCRALDDAGKAFVRSGVPIRRATDGGETADARGFELASPSISALRVCSHNQGSAFNAIVFDSVEFTR